VHGEPGIVSSFPELVCQVFDDTGLSRALDRGSLEQEIGEAAVETLRALSAEIDRIPDDRKANVLVSSPNMHEVRRLANQALHQMVTIGGDWKIDRRDGS
jgi:hypothetical protein